MEIFEYWNVAWKSCKTDLEQLEDSPKKIVYVNLRQMPADPESRRTNEYRDLGRRMKNTLWKLQKKLTNLKNREEHSRGYFKV